jgi:quercetin dioxygenase-like cupin family protein
MDYTHIPNLAELVPEISPDSIVSRTVHDDPTTKAILFAFAAGQELSEHTAAQIAMLHFIEGEADLTLGTERHTAQPGTWVHMPPRLPHSIVAKTPLVMLLVMVKPG